MGLLDQWEALKGYMQANTPRNTRASVSPAQVIDQGLLGGRIAQIPQRAEEIKHGLLNIPQDLAQLTSQEMSQAIQAAMAGKGNQVNPQQWIDAGLELSGMAPMMGLVGHTVYHGSPHKFDKFDMSKIGTGEGAQAYGHGLYFSESPEVARSYQATTTNGFGLPAGENVQGVANVIAMKGEDTARKMYAELGDSLEPTIQRAKQAIADQSAFYKVDIPDEAIPKMLDWDKPLSQQAPEVQVALKNAYPRQYDQATQIGMNGGDFISHMSGRGPASGVLADEFRQTLNEQGIPGIRYLDGTSRNAGDGTSNFVLFDDQIARILEVNGHPTGLLSWADEAKKAHKK